MTSASILTTKRDRGNHVFRKGVYDDEHEISYYAFAIIYQTNDSSMCKRQHSPRLGRNVDFLFFHSHHFLDLFTNLCRVYYELSIMGNKNKALSASQMYTEVFTLKLLQLWQIELFKKSILLINNVELTRRGPKKRIRQTSLYQISSIWCDNSFSIWLAIKERAFSNHMTFVSRHSQKKKNLHIQTWSASWWCICVQ